MGLLFPLVNLEKDQTFDETIVKHLAKILEVLTNLEE